MQMEFLSEKKNLRPWADHCFGRDLMLLLFTDERCLRLMVVFEFILVDTISNLELEDWI